MRHCRRRDRRLRCRHAGVNVGQEAILLVGLSLPRRLGHAARIEDRLLQATLHSAGGHELRNILTPQRRCQLAKPGLLKAQLTQLGAERAKLRGQTADALAQSLLLRGEVGQNADILLAKLAKLQTQLALRLRSGLSELPEIHAERSDVLSSRSLLSRRGQAQLRSKILKLPGLLNARKAQLPALQSSNLRQLFGRKAKLSCLRSRLKRRTRTRLAQLSRKRSELLLPPLLLFESLLRAVCRRFKARSPHLRGRPTLLLQNVALQLLFCHRLPRSTKSARANRLRPHILLSNLALPRDVGQRLLDGRIFKRAHKRRNLRRIKATARSGQRGNALLGRHCAHTGSAHQRLLRCGGRGARTCCGNIRARLRTAHLPTNAASQVLQSAGTTRRRRLPRRDAAKKLLNALSSQPSAETRCFAQARLCRGTIHIRLVASGLRKRPGPLQQRLRLLRRGHRLLNTGQAKLRCHLLAEPQNVQPALHKRCICPYAANRLRKRRLFGGTHQLAVWSEGRDLIGGGRDAPTDLLVRELLYGLQKTKPVGFNRRILPGNLDGGLSHATAPPRSKPRIISYILRTPF